MGEAKRRKAADPNYGKARPSPRGLIISPPLVVEPGRGIHIKSSDLDPQELRFALLFWDQLAWPDNNIIGIDGGAEAEFLLTSGVLTRPRYIARGNTEVGSVFLDSYAQAYRDLNQGAPGRWSISQGENSLLIEGGLLIPGRGAIVELHRAIPVPNADVPLADILEFKLKRSKRLAVAS